MAAPVFPGQVGVTLYFGTPFDYVNVPYNTQLILDSATKTITVQASCVRQTTWLSSWRLNIDDYQKIVGAQFALIIDTGVEDHGAHWYYVTSYRMLNKNCCEMTMQYDPLLSIGINRIYGITGIMRRWTVGNDAAWLWTSTAEPIDRGAPYRYNYYRLSLAGDGKYSNPIAGFPVNLTNTPTVISYWGDETEKFKLPSFSKAIATKFVIQDPTGQSEFTDGMQYINWAAPPDNAFSNYNAAIGFGMNLTSQSYILPISSYIEVTNSDYGYTTITGKCSVTPTNLTLTNPGVYGNQKTKEFGKIFSLYNDFTGDCVTVSNYEMSDTDIFIWCNPYITGGFYAKFHGYLFDTGGYSGAVSTPGWQPLTLTSATGQSSSLSGFNIRYAQQVNSIQSQLSVKQMLNATNREEINYANGMYQDTLGVAGNLGSILAGFLTGSSGIGLMNLGNGVSNLASSTFNYMAKQKLHEIELDDIHNQYQALGRQQMLYNDFLNGQGNIGDAAPPATKFSPVNVFSRYAYGFSVRVQTLAPSDLSRLDQFFNQYGYNVNGLLLADASYLNCRKRFTFIQADDVRIHSVNNGTPMTRLGDMQTTNFIAERFAAGIRIWNTIPDFDFTEPNVPRTYPFTDDTAEDAPGEVIIPIDPPPVPPDPGPDPAPSQVRDVILRYALSQKDVAESPLGSNNVVYNTAYYGRPVQGDDYPWCVVFIWYCFMINNYPNLFCGGSKTASCTGVLNYYKPKGKVISYDEARPGDFVIWTWYNSDGDLRRHIGMIAEKISASKYTTIEGNSSNKVQIRTRKQPYRQAVFINPYGD